MQAVDVVAGDGLRDIVAAVVDAYPRLHLVITAGKSGSWAWDTKNLTHTPAFAAEVVSTAGAGDAHLAGVLTALIQGHTLPDANRYGAVVAMLKLASPHTINPHITPESVNQSGLL